MLYTCCQEAQETWPSAPRLGAKSQPQSGVILQVCPIGTNCPDNVDQQESEAYSKEYKKHHRSGWEQVYYNDWSNEYSDEDEAYVAKDWSDFVENLMNNAD